MNERIWEKVTNSQALQGLFGGKPRIYSEGGKRDNPKAPYIVWQVISEVPYAEIGFKVGGAKFRIQFDVYSSSAKETKDIGKALEKAFIGQGIPVLRMGPYSEPGTKLYRRTIDMSFFKRGNK